MHYVEITWACARSTKKIEMYTSGWNFEKIRQFNAVLLIRHWEEILLPIRESGGASGHERK